MGRNRCPDPVGDRVTLTDGDWVDLKRDLTVGEARGYLFGGLREGPDGDQIRDVELTMVLRLLAWIAEWSFVIYEDGKPTSRRLPVTRDGIDALDMGTLNELLAALNQHELARSRPRKNG